MRHQTLRYELPGGSMVGDTRTRQNAPRIDSSTQGIPT